MTLSLRFNSNSSSAKKLKQEGFMEKETYTSSDSNSFDGTSSLTSQITEDKASVDIGCFDYPFDDITCSNDSLDFLEHIDENELSDCLYSGWPETENFDAVNIMFRSSDSRFGFEASNEYGSGCVSKRFIHKEQDKEQFNLPDKSHENQIKVPTEEHGMSGKRSSSSGNFGDVGQVSPTVLGSHNVKEITRTGSGDISRGASSFCQLQCVMQQLDSKTKICMKDNLYRLARGAEKRHKRNLNGDSEDKTDTNGDSEDKTDTNGARSVKRKTEYTNFMGVETDTNSVDRSIAHLLFYTASNSSAVGA